MTSKDLINILKEHIEFNIRFIMVDENGGHTELKFGGDDVGYSEKSLCLFLDKE